MGGNGGSGGQGGNGIGGAICNLGGLLLVTNATVVSNITTAGAGGAAGTGFYAGYPSTAGSPGTNGPPGVKMGGAISGVAATNFLKNSILSPNLPTDTNIFGPLIDAGNNISSDNQDSLTNSSSLNGVNPMLAPLGNYGGPASTMALLPGSPAINAADVTAFPTTDQRGYARPYGPAPDIGAFEYYPPNAFAIRGYANGLLDLVYTGTNDQTYRIQASVDLISWSSVSTNTLGSNCYMDTIFPTTNLPAQFFRAVSP